MTRTVSRRGFLGVLGSVFASAAIYDPEKAPFVPGKKLISIPAPVIHAPVPVKAFEALSFEGHWVAQGFNGGSGNWATLVWVGSGRQPWEESWKDQRDRRVKKAMEQWAAPR